MQIYLCMFTDMYMSGCMRVCMCVCVCMSMRVCVCESVWAYAHALVCMELFM